MARGVPLWQAVVVALLLGVVFAIAMVFFLGRSALPTGMAIADTGDVFATVAEEFGIEVDVDYNTVNFGRVARGDSLNTLPPGPVIGFQCRNIGNVRLDALIWSTDLWAGTETAQSYMFSVAEADPRIPDLDDCVGSKCFNAGGSKMTPTTMPTSGPSSAICFLDNLWWEEWRDECNVNFQLIVPTDETPGGKSAVVTLVAAADTTCGSIDFGPSMCPGEDGGPSPGPGVRRTVADCNAVGGVWSYTYSTGDVCCSI